MRCLNLTKSWIVLRLGYEDENLYESRQTIAPLEEPYRHNHSLLDNRQSQPPTKPTMRRPASYVALLVLLQLATTAPIPVRLPEDCKSHLTCRTHLQISDSTPATPPTTLLFPHFPTHELIGKRPQDENALDDEEPFDNHPLTPAANMNPSEALSSLTPLSSSYLLSLTSPSQPPPQSPPHDHVPLDNLPAKPTSSLSHLRKLDSIRYWTSSRTDLNYAAKTEELQTQDLRDSSVSPIVRCGEFLVSASNSAYLRVGQPIRLARDHSDLVVVGIVVLFLIVVVVVELGQKMVSL